MVLSSAARFHSKISTLTRHYFAYSWRNTFKIVSNLIATVEFLLFFNPQFTVSVQNVVLLNRRAQWACVIVDCRKYERSRVGYRWFHRHQKFIAKVSFHFQLKLRTLGILRTPTDCSRSDVAVVPLKLFTERCGMTVFLFYFVCETHSWILSKHFRCMLYRVFQEE